MLLRNVSGGTIIVRIRNTSISVGDQLCINVTNLEANSLLDTAPESWEVVGVVNTLTDLAAFDSDDLNEGSTNLYFKGAYAIIAAGTHTTVGGSATETVTVSGALATDLVFVQLVDEGTNTVTVLQAVAGTDEINVEFTADPGNDAIINYQLLRAV